MLEGFAGVCPKSYFTHPEMQSTQLLCQEFHLSFAKNQFVRSSDKNVQQFLGRLENLLKRMAATT
jgi:phosphatidate phosphatase PAH1